MPIRNEKMSEAVDSEGNYPIHLAAKAGNMRTLAALVNDGANLDVRNASGDTPLMISIIERNHDAAKFLVKKGADVNLSDRNGVSTLIHAAIVDHEANRKDKLFVDIIIHSKDYRYNEKDMERIKEFDLANITPPTKSREILHSNLQKVAAAAEKLIASTRGIYQSLMHAGGNDIKKMIGETKTSNKPQNAQPKTTTKTVMPEPPSVADSAKKQYKP